MYVERTYSAKPSDIQKKWHVIDASDVVVGRLASVVADLLRGKNKTIFTPTIDTGDFVVITNVEKVKFTGNKWANKHYWWHTNHIGGIKSRTATEQLTKHPELILYNAVKGMLPKGPLGRQQLTKLKLFVGETHAHEAQKPEVYVVSK